VLFHRLSVVVMGIGLTWVGAPASAAAEPTTQTTHEHSLVESSVDPLPVCGAEGPLYTITTTTNVVEHVTAFDDGRVHSHSTRTGSFVAEPLDSAGVSFSGRVTVSQTSSQSASGTVVFILRGTGSDGSTLHFRSVDHINERPGGSVNQFFRCN